MQYLDENLPILLNVEKTILMQSSLFSKIVLKNWQSVIKIFHVNNLMLTKRLAYRHILKSIVMKLNEKKQKIFFYELKSNLSVHVGSAVLIPLDPPAGTVISS